MSGSSSSLSSSLRVPSPPRRIASRWLSYHRRSCGSPSTASPLDLLEPLRPRRHCRDSCRDDAESRPCGRPSLIRRRRRRAPRPLRSGSAFLRAGPVRGRVVDAQRPRSSISTSAPRAACVESLSVLNQLSQRTTYTPPHPPDARSPTPHDDGSDRSEMSLHVLRAAGRPPSARAASRPPATRQSPPPPRRRRRRRPGRRHRRRARRAPSSRGRSGSRRRASRTTPSSRRGRPARRRRRPTSRAAPSSRRRSRCRRSRPTGRRRSRRRPGRRRRPRRD